ncbi:MAG: hypothetical protein Q9213_007809 [Squamulea squamosa]
MESALYHLVKKLDSPKRVKRSRHGSYSTPGAATSSPSLDDNESTDSSIEMQSRNLDSNQLSSGDHRGSPYRGCSLVSLCEQLRNTIDELHLVQNAESGLPPSDQTSISASVSQLFEHINSSNNLEILNDGLPVELPPRSLLTMACIPFFQSEGLATEIFDQTVFRQNIERMYDRPYNADDAAWAMCFNLVILLGLGMEQPANPSGDFLKPFLQNAIRAYVSMTTLLAPKLIDVQALALLVSN